MATHPTTDNLRVRLERRPDGQSGAIRVIVENNHPSQVMTLLRWDTPLDISCFRTGTLRMVDAASGKIVQGPGIKIIRKLPPSREDIIEIRAKGNVEQEFELNESWMPTDGRSVSISARGSWRAAWPKTKAEVTTEDLEAMTGAGAMQGTFVSEADVELKLHR
ncbi:hypothetical protein CLAFUW4_09262 [Fulvia fulva]|uniref:Uncharacterized protein n=1 Tax=Passalora fulva TaxID=5499 RepID=A0A9Q8PFH7_PASFU|nr:uncharacterized protein CLAFUR5_09363 [Fulvia fulva]KAK4613381.1 hypothetical protein CLAFUR4_09268 [Fulvia fulva]KAK4614446.1 hypothetical protein CLAFUR0_09260 [Fulvia fulva]UJO21484.1 hypothetical protein CLAFUR5_09363 [Fulvia fulva]WPV20787.1 hypothetical protein CLAFUW4_09262 [Fulvia fulva]WPV35014.1 hypothetical protein CLAFUW7_09263 [Fulvia fulva]